MLVIFQRFNFHVQTIFTKSLSIFYEINVYTLYFLLTNWYHRIIKSESNNDYARPSSTACYTVRLVICGLTRRHSMQRQRERERKKKRKSVRFRGEVGRVNEFPYQISASSCHGPLLLSLPSINTTCGRISGWLANNAENVSAQDV